MELHNCWVCFLEEAPTLFLSCVFLNSTRTFTHLAYGVFHFLSTCLCQGSFLCLENTSPRSPRGSSLPSILCSNSISSERTSLTSHPTWRPCYSSSPPCFTSLLAFITSCQYSIHLVIYYLLHVSFSSWGMLLVHL